MVAMSRHCAILFPDKHVPDRVIDMCSNRNVYLARCVCVCVCVLRVVILITEDKLT